MDYENMAKKWMDVSFNAIPTAILQIVVDSGEEFREITKMTTGATVLDPYGAEGVIMEMNGEEAKVRFEGGISLIGLERLQLPRKSVLPTWGTMWSFSQVSDITWNGRVDALSECGFRVFESIKFGLFFGLDGNTADSVSAHWVPLYVKRHPKGKENIADAVRDIAPDRYYAIRSTWKVKVADKKDATCWEVCAKNGTAVGSTLPEVISAVTRRIARHTKEDAEEFSRKAQGMGLKDVILLARDYKVELSIRYYAEITDVSGMFLTRKEAEGYLKLHKDEFFQHPSVIDNRVPEASGYSRLVTYAMQSQGL